MATLIQLRAVLFDASDTLFYNAGLRQKIRELEADPGLPLAHGQLSIAMRVVGERGLWPEDSGTHRQRFARWRHFYGAVITETAYCGSRAPQIENDLAALVCDASSYALFPEVSRVLSVLSAEGFALGIVSNFDGLLVQILRYLKLDGWFRVVITSFDTGFYKPDPRIFERALRALEVEPREAMFVGDSPYSDVGGAAAAGIRPVLIDRPGIREPSPTVLTIRNLEQLCTLCAR